MPAGFRVDELRGDPYALAGAPDRAFEYGAHAELAADGADVHRASLIGEARVACDHRQARDFRQIGDDVFADAVGEVLLFRVARHVGERQDGDRRSVAVRPWSGGIGSGGGGGRRARVPFPDADRPVDILDANLAAILEANVDPIADAFVDDR